MRRHVRYSALGKSRPVTLVFGAERREAEVQDESSAGLGLRLREVGGLAVGAAVVVESAEVRIDGTVLRIEALPDGAVLVGVRTSPGRS